jgi:hypothetical protein
MAFATLEEAWGLPAQKATVFDRLDSQTAWALPADSKQQSRLDIDNPQLGQLVGNGQLGSGQLGNRSNGSNGSHLGSLGGNLAGSLAGSLAGQQQHARRASTVANPSDANTFFNDGDESAAAMEARRYLARAYARNGVAGIIRALPPHAQMALATRTFNARRRNGRSWSACIMDFLRSPEKVLLVLLVAFALLVLYDTRRQSTAADLSALHQHIAPFPMMPGMTLTTS